MRYRLRMLMVYLLLAALVAVVPIGIARHMLAKSRPEAYAPEQPNYLAHQYPPRAEANLSEKLAGLLNADLHTMEAVPRVYLARLPETLPEIENAKRKKRVFTSSLLPIILRANELIIADRGRLLKIREKLSAGTALEKQEKRWLLNVAKKYRVRLAAVPTEKGIDKLLHKVDVVPASLALAQAAMESGWGTSKFAQQGNALFGEWVWGDDAQGIVPSGREEGKTHKIKSFDYLIDSVRSYMTNLNRHRSYEGLRQRRAELRKHSLPVTGAALAPSLVAYSERGADYVNDILSIIEYNDLDALDHALLDQTP